MHLYTYVSLAVVVLSTATLYLILRRNKSADCRYVIGLGVSAIIAIIASLLLPDMVSAFAVDLAMQLALSFFIAFLIYITLLFFSMMLISYIFPPKKLDELKKKWEEYRLEKQKSRELRQRQKEEAEKSQSEEENVYEADESETKTGKSETCESEIICEEQKEPVQKPESILKSIFINRFFRQKTEEISGDPVKDYQKESENNPLKYEISEMAENMYDNQSIVKETDVDMNADITSESTGEENIEHEVMGQAHDETAKTAGTEQETIDVVNTVEEETMETADSEIVKEDTGSELENATSVNDYDFTEACPDDESLKPEGTELLIQDDIFEQAALSLDQTIEDNTGNEKNVDTQDIIDKMGVDKVSSESVPYLDLNGLSLNELIDEAFLLKQKGRESEAATLYIEALNRNPDDEAAFWIVLDICSIYKRSGQAELAEDILLTYIDEFENLMSEEVKDQILQSLYS